MYTRIKICGITNLEDARAAADLGTDALGFIFVPNTPRYIEPEVAKRIIRNLPPFVISVGVFADALPEVILQTVRTCGLNAVQLHGSETPEYCSEINGPKLIKAFRIKDRSSLSSIPDYEVSAYLLDTYIKGKKGGTGETFNWNLAREAKKYGRIIVAGGLTPENVAQAILHVRPYAVDVGSGVESSPGKKDHSKIKAFVENVKALC